MTVEQRATWLAEVRREGQRRYDEQFSPTYDRDDSPIGDTHRRFVHSVVSSCPPGGVVLDAPCGTGKYFAIMLGRWLSVIGCDQSPGMLAAAAAKHPDVELRRVGLQELNFDSAVDAAVCIDAMEDIPPEEWPLVLAYSAGPSGPVARIYLTVEMTDEDWLVTPYDTARARGLPVVPREDITRGDAYHHYPSLTQVRQWLSDAGLQLAEEAHSDGDHPSYSYEHFLVTV